ncbi:ferredoxin--NADP reductase [bacterium]|nr:ferredoxin--NADP reductase [bacterium]
MSIKLPGGMERVRDSERNLTSAAREPSTGRLYGAGPVPFNARIIERRDLNDRLAIIRVKFEKGAPPHFEPGQYMDVGIVVHDAERDSIGNSPHRNLLTRSYSIASSPEREVLEFYVSLVKRGILTPRLWRLRKNDRLWVQPRPRGRFTLEPVPKEADVLLIATGTGIAPYISMLRTYRRSNRLHRAAVVHSARTPVELGYHEELRAMSKEQAGLRYIPTITGDREASTWEGLRGRVQTLLESGRLEALSGFSLDPVRAHVFLCGNPKMVDNVSENLETRGFTPHTRMRAGNIHTERYW